MEELHNMKDIFRYQLWHLLSLIVLTAAVFIIVHTDREIMKGALWGITTEGWFWLGIAVPIVHQIYVWLIWRLELFKRTFTSRWGVEQAFNAYAAVFTVLFVSRLIYTIIVAYSSRWTLDIKPLISLIIAAIIIPIVIYLIYSIKEYFTFQRAFGIDHFDKNYNEPYVKGGIFRYTDNGMYIYGLMILYLPGLLLFSKAAIIVAIFNHVYIWVHYYCTERPDMQTIYGKVPSK
jgi:hypothetical protein